MEFYKYHGAGNDFIIVDNRDGNFSADNVERIKLLCHRHFGIGADGILLLEKSSRGDFKMIYINSDGSRGSMCGNGGRSIVHFAHHILKIVRDPENIIFEAVDGMHEAKILPGGQIKLKMQDMDGVSERNGLPYIRQGTTPHNIIFVDDVKNFPVFAEGKKIADSDPDRINSNFVEIKDGKLNMRTYERGVEDETWACGTGACSAAVTAHHLGKIKESPVLIKMPGGELKVEFDPPTGGRDSYQNIWLTGPATLVFQGTIK